MPMSEVITATMTRPKAPGPSSAQALEGAPSSSSALALEGGPGPSSALSTEEAPRPSSAQALEGAPSSSSALALEWGPRPSSALSTEEAPERSSAPSPAIDEEPQATMELFFEDVVPPTPPSQGSADFIESVSTFITGSVQLFLLFIKSLNIVRFTSS